MHGETVKLEKLLFVNNKCSLGFCLYVTHL